MASPSRMRPTRVRQAIRASPFDAAKAMLLRTHLILEGSLVFLTLELAIPLEISGIELGVAFVGIRRGISAPRCFLFLLILKDAVGRGQVGQDVFLFSIGSKFVDGAGRGCA